MTSLLPELFSSLYKDLNEEQAEAMKLLHGTDNVFITGGAGTGKSHLMKNYLKGTDPKTIPVLASTGAAAVLIGGRTFHSFFGLGIMEGGAEKTIERALKDKRVVRRIKAHAIVIDEISMIPGEVLSVAEQIASHARGDQSPWGSLKVIAVGDFAQLPPVKRGSSIKDWAFLNPVWEKTNFKSFQLKTMMRAQEDQEFCEILNDVREGIVSDRLKHLLEWEKILPDDEEFGGSVLFARKVDVDRINNSKLAEIDSELHEFETIYSGAEKALKSIKANAPISEKLYLKIGAFVMIRQNDPKRRWVNGSLGHVERIEKDALWIKLLNGHTVELNQASFSLLDAEGREVAAARNFPVSLAWAVTIHKSQGATLDKAVVSLKGLWEPGQAYVALSRVRNTEALMISSWDERSFIADPQVKQFHQTL